MSISVGVCWVVDGIAYDFNLRVQCVPEHALMKFD